MFRRTDRDVPLDVTVQPARQSPAGSSRKPPGARRRLGRWLTCVLTAAAVVAGLLAALVATATSFALAAPELTTSGPGEGTGGEPVWKTHVMRVPVRVLDQLRAWQFSRRAVTSLLIPGA